MKIIILIILRNIPLNSTWKVETIYRKNKRNKFTTCNYFADLEAGVPQGERTWRGGGGPQDVVSKENVIYCKCIMSLTNPEIIRQTLMIIYFGTLISYNEKCDFKCFAKVHLNHFNKPQETFFLLLFFMYFYFSFLFFFSQEKSLNYLTSWTFPYVIALEIEHFQL